MFWSVPGARPSPRSIRPGYSASSVPNCSAITSGAWFGQHDAARAEPDRRRVRADVGDQDARRRRRDAGMLWCSAYQTRAYPSSSACCASATLAAKLSAAVWPRPIGARSSIDSLMRIMLFRLGTARAPARPPFEHAPASPPCFTEPPLRGRSSVG